MIPALLLVSLILTLVGVLLATPLLVALGGPTLIVLLAALGKKVPGILLIAFWIWVVAVLLGLILLGDQSSPSAALYMLIGIWLFPVLLWPLGFARFFDNWRQQ